MIIHCDSCLRKFIVKNKDIPEGGRVVQCGFCSITWHQMPVYIKTKTTQIEKVNKIPNKINKKLSTETIRASDGKMYKYLGNQWAQQMSSGKTGLFAKKKISQELDILMGRKVKIVAAKKNIERELDPSSQYLGDKNQLPDVYKEKKGLSFFGYVFILIIVSVSTIGVIKTFEDDWLNYFPQDQYIFDLLDEQLEYIIETSKNITTIIKDLINSY
jgi:predicted Zn finger-like uncharacterized protein